MRSVKQMPITSRITDVTLVLFGLIGAENFIERSRLILIVSHPASIEQYIVVALTIAIQFEETRSL